MTSLFIDVESFPDLSGKTALITGAASGIGFATAIILASRGAEVHILDLDLPIAPVPPEYASLVKSHQCDIRSWKPVREIFGSLPRLDMVFANAGVSEETDYFADTFDDNGALEEPEYGVLGVNLRAVLNVIKLGWNRMRRDNVAGSIVVTTSATAYAPEQSLPVYSAAKLALVGLVRSLRANMIRDNITINGVAPGLTITRLVPKYIAEPIIAAGLPTSSPEHVGAALVWSAVGVENQQVEMYGKDDDSKRVRKDRWNGRVILTIGSSYTELEEPIADLRRQWFGEENAKFTRIQQTVTDFRKDRVAHS